MRKSSLLAIAGAAIGYLCCTERGRSMLRRAGDTMRDKMHQVQERLGSGDRTVNDVAHDTLAEPPPETAMAQALEEALAS